MTIQKNAMTNPEDIKDSPMRENHLLEVTGIDHHEMEKFAAWEKRNSSPLFKELDRFFADVLHQNDISTEFEVRVDPESYRIPEKAIAILVCSDERNNGVDYGAILKDKLQSRPFFLIRIPGSGVGWKSDQEIEDLRNRIVDSTSATEVAATSHYDCGAAAADAPAGMDPNLYAQKIVENLVRFNITNWGFIDQEMNPALESSHPGSCLVVDATGRKNHKPDSKIPEAQFLLNRKVYGDPVLAIAHIKILAGIPLGNHGIGLKSEEKSFGYSKENPFYIFVSADDNNDLQEKMKEAEQAIQTYPKGIIRIVGFLAPRVN